MIVAVKQKLRTFFGQHSAKIGGVDETSKITSRRADRRVMDQHHAEAAAGLLEGFGETSELPWAKPSRRQERSARDGGRKRNQGHVAPAKEVAPAPAKEVAPAPATEEAAPAPKAEPAPAPPQPEAPKADAELPMVPDAEAVPAPAPPEDAEAYFPSRFRN